MTNTRFWTNERQTSRSTGLEKHLEFLHFARSETQANIQTEIPAVWNSFKSPFLPSPTAAEERTVIANQKRKAFGRQSGSLRKADAPDSAVYSIAAAREPKGHAGPPCPCVPAIHPPTAGKLLHRQAANQLSQPATYREYRFKPAACSPATWSCGPYTLTPPVHHKRQCKQQLDRQNSIYLHRAWPLSRQVLDVGVCTIAPHALGEHSVFNAMKKRLHPKKPLLGP